MTFGIIWDKGAYEELNKLEVVVEKRIAKKIRELEQNPFSLDIKKLKGMDAYRLRVGDYRIIVDIDNSSKTIRILKVGHRKNVYER